MGGGSCSEIFSNFQNLMGGGSYHGRGFLL